MYTSIVVGTDGSSRARQAVQEAARIAKLTGAKLHLVSAYHPPSQAAVGLGAEVMVVNTLSDSEVRSSVEEVLDELAKEITQDGVAVATYPCVGGAADALLDVAEHQNADLIVVGCRGMAGARRFLGSVPNSVSHHARCSVLIAQTN